MRFLPSILPALLVAAAAWPMQGPPVFNAQTRAIQINVVVKGADGKSVHGLTHSDFVVTDNGKPREVRLFSVDDGAPVPSKPTVLPPGYFSNRFGVGNAPPMATAIVMPGSELFQAYVRPQLVQAIRDMQPGDTVAVYSLFKPSPAPPCCGGPQFRTLQDYTSDRQQVIRTVMESSLSGFPVVPPPDPYFWMRTIASRLISVPGRKRIIWLGETFGPLSAWLPAYEATADLITRANIAVYIVDIPPPAQIVDEPQRLAYYDEIARGFGGQVKYSGADFHEAIQQALEDPLYSYDLGFYLSPGEADGKIHKLNVSVAGQPRLELHYRSEYGAAPDRDVPLDSPDPTSALISPVDLTDVGIDATVSPAEIKTGQAIRISIVLDPETIKRQRDGSATVTEVFAEQDSAGNYVAKIEDKTKLIWPEAQPLGRYEKTIPIRAGAVSVRVVVRDSATGRIGSVTIPLPGTR